MNNSPHLLKTTVVHTAIITLSYFESTQSKRHFWYLEEQRTTLCLKKKTTQYFLLAYINRTPSTICIYKINSTLGFPLLFFLVYKYYTIAKKKNEPTKTHHNGEGGNQQQILSFHVYNILRLNHCILFQCWLLRTLLYILFL